MKIGKAMVLGAFAALVSAAPAFAATVIGRISYIYPEGNKLILDAQKEYDVASGVSMEKHGVAEFVRLTLDSANKVTAIGPGPASQAGYWVGKVGDQS